MFYLLQKEFENKSHKLNPILEYQNIKLYRHRQHAVYYL